MGGTIDWRVVRRLATGSVPMTALTLFALSHLDIRGHVADELITAVLSVALFGTAAVLILRKRITAAYARWMGELDPGRTAWLTVATGAVLGVLVSISSVGAGAMGVTALLLLYPRLPTVRIVGSDIAHAVPLTLVAGIGHWIIGSIDFVLLSSLLVGSLPGIIVGSYMSARIPDVALRLTLAATLIIAGSKLVL
jgi:uncharacterized membrane protein YfcA